MSVDAAGKTLLVTDAGIKALGAILFLEDAWQELTAEERAAVRVVLSETITATPTEKEAA